MSTRSEHSPARLPRSALGRAGVYLELTKPRIALLVLAVAVGSFYLAAPRAVDLVKLVETVIGVSLLAFGIFALNHYVERDVDARMLRTIRRPLPSRRLAPRSALAFGSVLTAAAVIGITATLGMVAGAVALFTFVSYIFVYTPLKRLTIHHTFPGALSGAMPPLLGWASARGTLDPGAWILFGVLFFWQFPHFLALELLYRQDYKRGGIRVVTASPAQGAWVVGEIVVAMALLIGMSLAPFLAGMAGRVYLACAAALGAVLLVFVVRAAVRRDARSGRLLLRASVSYLPLLFLLLVLDAA